MSPKPMFVMLVFILLLVGFASAAIGDADLTSGGQSQNLAGGSSPAGTVVKGESQVKSNAASSICGSSYTVKSGDTLSKIAQACGVALKDLLAVNRGIGNPNLILVGQKITIYNAPPTPKPSLTPKAKPTVTPTAAPKAKATSTQKKSLAVKAAPVSGLKPGDTITVVVPYLKPNAKVQLAIGKLGFQPAWKQEATADEDGILNVPVVIPKTARAREKWVVTITTLEDPQKKIMGEPFVISAK